MYHRSGSHDFSSFFNCTCLHNIFFKMKIEHVFAMSEGQILVKWERTSLLHMQWVFIEDIPGIEAILLKYPNLPSDYPLVSTLRAERFLEQIERTSLPKDDEYYEYAPDIHDFYLPTVEDRNKCETTRVAVLVKWRDQPYSECTWEWIDEPGMYHPPSLVIPDFSFVEQEYKELAVHSPPKTNPQLERKLRHGLLEKKQSMMMDDSDGVASTLVTPDFLNAGESILILTTPARVSDWEKILVGKECCSYTEDDNRARELIRKHGMGTSFQFLLTTYSIWYTDRTLLPPKMKWTILDIFDDIIRYSQRYRWPRIRSVLSKQPWIQTSVIVLSKPCVTENIRKEFTALFGTSLFSANVPLDPVPVDLPPPLPPPTIHILPPPVPADVASPPIVDVLPPAPVPAPPIVIGPPTIPPFPTYFAANTEKIAEDILQEVERELEKEFRPTPPLWQPPPEKRPRMLDPAFDPLSILQPHRPLALSHLGLSIYATEEQIRSKYLQELRRTHPDRNQGIETSEYHRIVMAYKYLKS